MLDKKFRAWDPNEKRMFHFTCATFFDDIVYANEDLEDGDVFQHQLEPKYIMQMVGLIDDKDNLIYEGDIVKNLYSDWPSQPENDERTFEEYIDSISHIGRIIYNPFYGVRVQDVGGVLTGGHARIS